MGLFLLTTSLLALAIATATPPEADDNNNNTQKWVAAVERILSSFVIGRIEPHFTPDYVGQRTMTDVITMQSNRLRARVATAIAECDSTSVSICPFDHIGEKATLAVLADLRSGGFDAHWIRDAHRCPGFEGYLFVDSIPLPKK